ncbi:MAG: sensor histidine kinase [Bdellovibrio bacteriovorus]
MVLLIAAATMVGYLFDRGRTEALAQRDLEQLRLHAERGVDEVERRLQRLAGDVALLAQTPPVPDICRSLRGDGLDALAGSTLEQWTERLQHIFNVFAGARPEYLEISLLGIQGGLRSLVSVERRPQGQTAASQGHGRGTARLDIEAALRLPPGTLHFGPLEIERDASGSRLPPRVTLAATTPFQDGEGGLVGLLLVRMDLTPAFERARAFAEGIGTLTITDERGEPLLLTEPIPTLGPEAGTSAPSAIVLADVSDRSEAAAQGGALIAAPPESGHPLAYVKTLRWDPEDPSRRLTFVLSQSPGKLAGSLEALRRESLLGMVALLLVATLLAVWLIRRQTRSLSALAGASDAIAAGDFQVELPADDGSEVGSLARAFRHMAAEVEQREGALAALNQDLERRVEARTLELTRERDLQRLILDSVGDGVVVTDRDGRFVLWNRKAEQIVGSVAESVPLEQWSTHFGIYRDESGDPVPPDELPLVRALRGESTGSSELYLCNPRRADGRWAQVTARPLWDQAMDLWGAVAVMVDVTETKRLQARVQAHRTELRRFGRLFLGAEIASATAHHLSQPLGALSNYAAAALRLHRQGRLGATELGDMLERIEDLSVQAGVILDRLRARIRRSDNPATAFDIDAVVTSCLDFLHERIQRDGVQVERRSGDQIPPLMGDPLELEEALIQVVANALEAMEGVDRAKRRLLLVTGHEAERGLVTIEIGDTGPGVSVALAGRLFHPWETDKPGALGIGLSIVQTTIESFGGHIRMEPGASAGTLFRIELPVVRGGRG